jgi:hypothetical protein
MQVVGLLEKAASNCQDTSDSSSSNWASIIDWDKVRSNARNYLYFKSSLSRCCRVVHLKAVAIYTGSEPREDGTGGYFIYTLASSECVKFGTCKKGDRAPVNTLVFEAFNDGKNLLNEGNCAEVMARSSQIKSLMIIPIIQGLIRAVYALDVQNDFQETTQGTGAAYAAAILPLVSKCNEGNAAVIYNDLKPGNSLKGSYEVVKASLERSYECLGINCEHVGGLINLRSDGYLLGAEACHGLLPISSEDEKVQSDLEGDNPFSHMDSDDVIEDVDPPVALTGHKSSVVGTFSIVLIIFGIINFVFLIGNVWLCTRQNRNISKKKIDTKAASTEACAMESLPPRNAFSIVTDEDDINIV